MTAYDLDTLVDRTSMGSSKWTAMGEAARTADVDLERCRDTAGAPIAPFSVADLDLANAPEIIDALQGALARGLVLGYTVPTDHYLGAVTGWMRRRHGWDVDPDWIRVTPGVIPAFTWAIRELTAPGDGIIVQTPAYYPMYRSITSSGRRIVRNPLVESAGRFHLDLDELEQLAKDPSTTMLLLCSPHNPTGRVWERWELEEIARIVLENDLLLVSDEIHADLVQEGHEHLVASTIDPRLAERTLVLTSPSKSFNLAGLGIANAIIPDPGLRARLTEARDDLGFDNPNVLGAVACEAAYTRAEPWLDAVNELVARNHRRVREIFAERLPAVRVCDLEGTYLQWIDLRALGLPHEELTRLHACEAMLYCDEGAVFGPEGEGFARLVIATPTPVLEAALDRLCSAYERALAERPGAQRRDAQKRSAMVSSRAL
ncbi:pyridoxal phosphate-dependent aminotransferase [Brachybacterium sp. MASK1Z-5]|uniref:cysteine-S-conjugate beta-lyase n=1 Tax=Brachybacterium halotolerans TaxID=2795215 RepID=A0ABS1BAM8_9MICO|nr:MalY/PatB family protein [Brachybacterium halotolerans]MBK0331683.1 pyridoxal phosphate-dependent aminotransferase [Brachybacterium halotolerans]